MEQTLSPYSKFCVSILIKILKCYEYYWFGQIVDYFKNTSNGRYIDIGSFHPFRGSNTYLLYKKGWSGINIDLNKTSIDLFKLARPNDINLNLAISDANKKIKVYQTKDLGKMNTIDSKFASFFLKNYYVRESYSYNLNDIL